MQLLTILSSSCLAVFTMSLSVSVREHEDQVCEKNNDS